MVGELWRGKIYKLNPPYCRVARKNSETCVILFILIAINVEVLVFYDYSLCIV